MQFQFRVPVIEKTPVRKGIKIIDKFRERKHPVSMRDGLHGIEMDGWRGWCVFHRAVLPFTHNIEIACGAVRPAYGDSA